MVEFQPDVGPLPLIVATPKKGVHPDPKPEEEIPNTWLTWDDVRATQCMKRSVWAGIKRTIW